MPRAAYGVFLLMASLGVVSGCGDILPHQRPRPLPPPPTSFSLQDVRAAYVGRDPPVAGQTLSLTTDQLSQVLLELHNAKRTAPPKAACSPTETGANLVLDLTDGTRIEVGAVWICHAVPSPEPGEKATIGVVSTKEVTVSEVNGGSAAYTAPDLAEFLVREQQQLFHA